MDDKFELAHQTIREQNQEQLRRILKEQDRTKRDKQLFLFAYEKTFSVNRSCDYAHVSRRTYQYWIKKDLDFLKARNDIEKYEIEFVEDILKMHIVKGSISSILFYMSRHHPRYMKPTAKRIIGYLKDMKKNDPQMFQQFFKDAD